MGRTHLFPSELQDIRVQIIAQRGTVEKLKALRNPIYQKPIEDAEREVGKLECQIVSDANQRFYDWIHDLFSQHPLGHQMCHLDGVLSSIRFPAAPEMAPAPLPFEHYQPQGQSQCQSQSFRPEYEQ